MKQVKSNMNLILFLQVKSAQSCKPVVSTKCATVEYQECAEVPVEDCTQREVSEPTQASHTNMGFVIINYCSF